MCVLISFGESMCILKNDHGILQTFAVFYSHVCCKKVTQTQGPELDPVGNPRLSCLRSDSYLDGMNFLTPDLWCTLPPTIPPNHSGVVWVNQTFQPTTWQPRGFSLREIGVLATLFTPVQGIHLRKKALVVRGPPIFCTSCFGITFTFRPTWNDATSWFITMTMLELCFFLFFLCVCN